MTGRLKRVWRPALARYLVLATILLAGCAYYEPEPRRLSIKDTEFAASRARTAHVPPASAARGPIAPARSAQATTNVGGNEGCNDGRSCDGLLRALVESRERSWINNPPTAQAHVSGVRMFAYRVLRPRLTCGELRTGMEELRGVPEALATPPAGSNPTDVARAIDLAAKVQTELRAEQDARCKPAAAPAEQPPPPQPRSTPPSSTPSASPPGQAQPPPPAGQPERRPEQ